MIRVLAVYRRMFQKPCITLWSATGIIIILLALLLVYVKWIGIYTVRVQASGSDASTLVFFPVIEVDNNTQVPMSFSPQIDWFGYNERRIDESHPRRVSENWHFRYDPRASKYGFVLRHWAIGESVDNSDVRVFWLSPSDLERAQMRGTVLVPPFEHLPKFELKIQHLELP